MNNIILRNKYQKDNIKKLLNILIALNLKIQLLKFNS